ncbi:MAG: hypothetical protein WCI74_12950 [Actinomycetes bacterium]
MTDTPNDPNLHWDGQRWIRWNGSIWLDASTGAPAQADQPVQADDAALRQEQPLAFEPPPAFEPPAGTPPPGGSKRHTGLIIGVVVACLLILGGVAFGAMKIIGSRTGDNVAPTPTPSILPNTGPTWTSQSDSPEPAPSTTPAPIPTSDLPAAYTEELRQVVVSVCANKYVAQYKVTEASANMTCECIWRGYVAKVPIQDFLASATAGAAAQVPEWALNTESECLLDPKAY